MMLWPAVTLLGFLVLTALVIAMGTLVHRPLRAGAARESPPRDATPPPSRWVRSPPDRSNDARPPLPPPEGRGLSRSGGSRQSQSVGGVEHRPVERLEQVERRCTFGSSHRQK